MIKLLHTCDLNLGAKLPYPPEVCRRLEQAQLTALDTILHHAVEQQVNLVVFGGNLFAHHAPNAVWREQVVRRFAAVPETVRLVVVSGCYDHPLGRDSVYADPDFSPWYIAAESHESSPQRWTIHGQRVFFYTLPWHCEPGENARGGMQRCTSDGLHLGAFHSHKLNYQPNPYYDPLVHWRTAIESWQLDYVMVGNRRAADLVNAQQRCLAASPGTPQGLAFYECGDCCCTLVECDGQEVRCQALPCQALRFEQQTLELQGHDAGSLLHKYLGEVSDDRLALRLRLIGKIEELFDPGRTVARHRDDFAHFELQDETRFLDSDYMTRLAQEETVRGILCRRLVEKAIDAGEQQRLIYERAARELLQRFHAVEGDEA